MVENSSCTFLPKYFSPSPPIYWLTTTRDPLIFGFHLLIHYRNNNRTAYREASTTATHRATPQTLHPFIIH